MKYLNKPAIILSLFFIFLLSSTPLMALRFTILTEENLEQVADSIANIYGAGHGIEYREKVYNFLARQLSGTKGEVTCSHIVPEVTDAQWGESISFSWVSPSLMLNYAVNSFNLRTTEMEERTTSENQITVAPIDPNAYLFSFLAQCTFANTSNPVIIIADKDIFFQLPSLPNSATGSGEDHFSSTRLLQRSRISPNPFQEEINIQLKLTEPDRVSILLYDLSGRIVKQIEPREFANFSSLSLSTAGLPAGVYTLVLQSRDQRLQRQLVKLE